MGGGPGSLSSMVFGIVILAIFVGVFLALRKFWCWYWKINKIVSLLESQNMLLLKLIDSGDTEVVEISSPSSEVKEGE